MDSRKLNMAMRRKVIARKIIQCLQDNEAHTTEHIHAYVNEHYRYGATMNQIGNILAKYPEFEKVGMQKVPDYRGWDYYICTWRLKD